VGNNTFQSPNLFGFDEDQNILLAAPLTVDVGTSPIPAGTVVASHYIFFDPGPSQHVIGTVNFDSDVLAIITGTANLAASDFLANTGVNYLNPNNRGLEAGDSITISGPRQILSRACSSAWGLRSRPDRILPEAAVPEPECSHFRPRLRWDRLGETVQAELSRKKPTSATAGQGVVATGLMRLL
jgi:hypothetical protein